VTAIPWLRSELQNSLQVALLERGLPGTQTHQRKVACSLLYLGPTLGFTS